MRSWLVAVLIAVSARVACGAPWMQDMDAMQKALAQGEHARAVDLGTVALASAEAMGPSSGQLAFTLNELARAQALVGAPERAVPLLERLLALLEADLGSTHASLEPVLGSLTSAERRIAGLAWRVGDARSTEAHLTRALIHMRRRHAGAHPAVAGLLRELARTAEKQGRSDQAVERLEAAVTMLRQAGDSSALVLALEDLGDLHASLGHALQGEALMKEALVLAARLLGPDHAKLARLLEHLGTVLDAVGQEDRARRAYERALDRWTKKLGESHPLVAIRRAHLASRLAAAGENARARELADQAAAALAAAPNVDPALVAQVRTVQARVRR